MRARQTAMWLAVLGLMAIIALWHRATSTPMEASPEGLENSTNGEFVVGSPVRRSYSQSKPHVPHEFADPLTDQLAAIKAETDPLKREELLSSAVDAVANDEIPGILAVLQKALPADVALAMSERLVRRWAESDVRAAAQWAEQLADGPSRQASLNNVAIEWAVQDYSQAADWVRRLPNEAERTDFLRAIAYEITPLFPMEALRVAVELPPTQKRDELIGYTAMEWASQSPVDAGQWAQHIGDPELRAQVLANVAMAWADQDPQSAATLVATELPTGRAQADAAVGVVERWVQVQPEAAAAWVHGFPEGALRETAMANLRLLWPRPGFTQVR